jgi:hypothetical protein
MISPHYLVEMTFAPFGSLLTPQEVLTFTDRFVLPTLETCERLTSEGRIVAGGPCLAAVGFSFIAKADSPEELEDMVVGLPLWARAQTRVVPLGTFASRADAVRQRIQQLRPQPSVEAVPTN